VTLDNQPLPAPLGDGLRGLIDHCKVIKFVDKRVTCFECDEHYYVANGGSDCYLCDGNCLNCFNTPKNCTSCQNGMSLNNDTRVCFSCIVNCKTCPDTTSCSVCNPYYFVNSQSLQCDRCLSHCEICNGTSSCNRCELNYELLVEENEESGVKTYSCKAPKNDLSLLIGTISMMAIGIVVIPLAGYVIHHRIKQAKDEKNELLKAGGTENGQYFKPPEQS